MLTHLNRSKDAVSMCGLDGILDALIEFFTSSQETSKRMIEKELVLRYVQDTRTELLLLENNSGFNSYRG